MKLEEERRRDRVIRFRIVIHDLELLLVDDLDARDWNAKLDRRDDCGSGALHGLERAGGR